MRCKNHARRSTLGAMPPDSFDDLLPLLEVLGAHEAATTSITANVVSPVLRPFVGHLVISYTVDEGDSGRALHTSDLLARGIDESSLHQRALANLARHVEKVGIRLRSYGEMMAVLFDGDLEATLMLYPTLWTHLCAELGDDLVVAVPARDVLAVAPVDSREGIAALHAVIERVWPRDEHPLTTELFHFDGKAWRVAPSSQSSSSE
jgi:hypothetical protein